MKRDCWICKHAVFVTRSEDDCDLDGCTKEPEYLEKEIDNDTTIIAENCKSFEERETQ